MSEQSWGWRSKAAMETGQGTVFYQELDAEGEGVGEVEVNGITRDKSVVRWDDVQWFRVGRYLRGGRPNAMSVKLRRRWGQGRHDVEDAPGE